MISKIGPLIGIGLEALSSVCSVFARDCDIHRTTAQQCHTRPLPSGRLRGSRTQPAASNQHHPHPSLTPLLPPHLLKSITIAPSLALPAPSSRSRLLLLLLPQRAQPNARDLDNLEAHTGNITLGFALATKAGEQDLVIFIDKVEAAVVGYCVRIRRLARWPTKYVWLTLLLLSRKKPIIPLSHQSIA